jgi:alcohol dehydrogenase class IV
MPVISAPDIVVGMAATPAPVTEAIALATSITLPPPSATSCLAEPAAIESRILALGGDPEGIGAAGADRSKLDHALDAILQRPELGFAPQPPNRAELEQLVQAAW